MKKTNSESLVLVGFLKPDKIKRGMYDIVYLQYICKIVCIYIGTVVRFSIPYIICWIVIVNDCCVLFHDRRTGMVI